MGNADLCDRYFDRLHPFNGVLDPLLHTPDFVRSRSALLFTWILAITAQFDAASNSMAKRLRLHGENLSKYVHANGYRSVEIAQGYYISLLSATPAHTMSEERSWIYTNYAFGMAAELVLDPLPHSYSLSQLPPRTQDHVNVALNTNTGGARGVDAPEDAYYRQRLARNRERTWLRILLWERAHSSARGRMSSFPETELTLRIKDWWRHPLAHAADRLTCAFILLRRQLAMLHDEIKQQAEQRHANCHWVRDLVDSTLKPWRQAWLASPDSLITESEKISNLHLNYVYMHGRLWTLSFAVYGPANGGPDADAINEDCFEAAVACCEIAVRDLQQVGEPIYCMLAPTWAMISYAAVLALKLFPSLYGTRPGSEVELVALVSQVALQLETAGTTPPHRFGIAALLGQHLFFILRTRANVLKNLAQSGRQVEATETASSSQWKSAQPMLVDAQGRDGQPGDVSDQPTRVDPMLWTSDPFLTAYSHGEEEVDTTDDAFGRMIREWFGQGFGGVV